MNLPLGNPYKCNPNSFYHLYNSTYKIEKFTDIDNTVKYQILHSQDGYGNFWGAYFGTPREIAKELFLSYVKSEHYSIFNGYDGYTTSFFNKDFMHVDQFLVTFKPEVKVVFQEGITAADGVDVELLAEQITASLKKLMAFVPFS